jgi:ADP-dependent NAD(P)H-hydrate dehydratase
MTKAIFPAPQRPADAHKGTFGTVVVIGGSTGMIGAPALAATAALRIGCGLAKIVTAPELLHHCLTIEPSATGLPLDLDDNRNAGIDIDNWCDESDVMAIGPGMGMGRIRQEFIEEVLRQPRRVVLDADGLNNLAELPDPATIPRCPTILTPHPGEFRRLASAAYINGDPTDPDDRPRVVAELAARYSAVVVLKGHRTVISDGQRTITNESGNPALATAGSGDVLTGTIAGLVAQGMELFDAAVLGVHLHGKAADLWAAQHGQAGLLARDLAALLPDALNQHRT